MTSRSTDNEKLDSKVSKKLPVKVHVDFRNFQQSCFKVSVSGEKNQLTGRRSLPSDKSLSELAKDTTLSNAPASKLLQGSVDPDQKIKNKDSHGKLDSTFTDPAKWNTGIGESSILIESDAFSENSHQGICGDSNNDESAQDLPDLNHSFESTKATETSDQPSTIISFKFISDLDDDVSNVIESNKSDMLVVGQNIEAQLISNSGRNFILQNSSSCQSTILRCVDSEMDELEKDKYKIFKTKSKVSKSESRKLCNRSVVTWITPPSLGHIKATGNENSPKIRDLTSDSMVSKRLKN